MIFRLGTEDIEPNHWVAWVLDLPGCYSAARTLEDAVAGAPSEIAVYFEWLGSYGLRAPALDGEVLTEVVQSFRSYVSEGDYIVNAFFEDDRRPLLEDEVRSVLPLLTCTRPDLLKVVQPLSSEQLDAPIPGEVQGSIRGILKHVAWAEWWYLDRLDLAFPDAEMPLDVMGMLERVRVHATNTWPGFVNSTRITERVGEKWSPRKVVRRTLWHERAHTRQIARYLGQRGSV
jgi:predicted RNase H-like HicB family nuclease/uncharacterized damage-inducible protein DinB